MSGRSEPGLFDRRIDFGYLAYHRLETIRPFRARAREGNWAGCQFKGRRRGVVRHPGRGFGAGIGRLGWYRFYVDAGRDWGWRRITGGRGDGGGLRDGGLWLRGQERQKQAKGQFNTQRTVDATYPHVPLQNCGLRQRASFATVRRATIRQSSHKMAMSSDKTHPKSKFFYIMGEQLTCRAFWARRIGRP